MNLNEKNRFALIAWSVSFEISDLRFHEELPETHWWFEYQNKESIIKLRVKECERLLKALDDEGNDSG